MQTYCTTVHTKCPKILRKSVLHLLKYTANLHLSRCRSDMRYVLGHSVSSIYCCQCGQLTNESNKMCELCYNYVLNYLKKDACYLLTVNLLFKAFFSGVGSGSGSTSPKSLQFKKDTDENCLVQ